MYSFYIFLNSKRGVRTTNVFCELPKPFFSFVWGLFVLIYFNGEMHAYVATYEKFKIQRSLELVYEGSGHHNYCQHNDQSEGLTESLLP